MFGLTAKQYNLITQRLSECDDVTEVVIFGSRALGTHKVASDLDLVIRGPRVTRAVLNALGGVLNDETPVPFTFDLVMDDENLSAELREHIEHHGLIFWARPKS